MVFKLINQICKFDIDVAFIQVYFNMALPYPYYQIASRLFSTCVDTIVAKEECLNVCLTQRCAVLFGIAF